LSAAGVLDYGGASLSRLVQPGRLRAPGYAFAFVLTLGLGIGANTAIFSLVSGVILQLVPYPDADRIVVPDHPARARTLDDIGFSFTEIEDLRQRARSSPGRTTPRGDNRISTSTTPPTTTIPRPGSWRGCSSKCNRSMRSPTAQLRCCWSRS
jgi:hypothetical protein